MGAPVAVDVAKINCVVASDPDRWIAAANATWHGEIGPGQAVVARHGHALAAGAGTAGRVWDINCSIGANLYVAVNSPVTLDRVKNIYARAKGNASVIAAGTLSAAGDILRTIIDGIQVKRVSGWWRRRAVIVRPASKSFVIGTGRRAAGDEVRPSHAVVIRERGVAVAGGKFQPKNSTGDSIYKSNRVEACLDRGQRVFPQRTGRRGGIVKADAQLLRAGGEKDYAAGVDLVMLECGYLWDPVDAD